jgi:hypothetical protein
VWIGHGFFAILDVGYEWLRIAKVIARRDPSRALMTVSRLNAKC